MVSQQAHLGTSVAMAGIDSAAVHISLMAVLVLGAVILALLGSFAVLVLVPLAAVVVRKGHAKRSRPSSFPAEPEGSIPLPAIGPRHANPIRNT
ncbi:hypothetical protein PJL15_00992 [Paenarthrobacter nitroguajacolicus]|nr:hypothetical protein [Paenarthrobacter nitroguajacolicus]